MMHLYILWNLLGIAEMQSRDNKTLYIMAQELVVDIKRKVHLTDSIVLHVREDLAFELGFAIGQMREKHKLQMEYYRQFRNKYHNISRLKPPMVEEGMRPVHYVVGMEWIHLKEIEVETIVETLLRVPKKVLDERVASGGFTQASTTTTMAPYERPRHGPARMGVHRASDLKMRAHFDSSMASGEHREMNFPFRNGGTLSNGSVYNPASASRMEAELKQKYRDEFMKRHGRIN